MASEREELPEAKWWTSEPVCETAASCRRFELAESPGAA